ncbi:alpha/beta fold hydrolase [Leifsonia sp. ZF2019]|uniref:alpha/beta hydrolase n=1 Tax=Leifsonia sp. ZF2019 TaxID=2781978 RepID=UPI001CBC3DE7|nr:alpha/beta fold hydrolase [Leifsonia sp. ZF2019]UAJ80743.1 alpha/beta fold hydrolase [Leifsonia sp. ZF2019]
MSVPAAEVAISHAVAPADQEDAPVTAVLLHGYGSNEHDLAGLSAALPEGLPWVSPRAPLPTPNGGAAWFPISTPGSPDPAPVAAATDAIWAWVDAQLGPDALVLPIGFSQGGLMASQLLRTRPERVAATVVLAGFVQATPQRADAWLATSRPPAFWGRGDADGVIAGPAVDRTAAWLPAHTTLEQHVYPGLGHGISAQEIDDLRTFLRRVLTTPGAQEAPAPSPAAP